MRLLRADGSLIGLGPLLAIAMLARLPAVLWSGGYEFLDEQFQYVDPAHHLATGSPLHDSVDRREGLRSWVYPWILAQILRAAMALGIAGPDGQMLMVRAVLAAFSSIAVVALHGLVKARGLRGGTLLLVFMAANGLMVMQSVRPNAPAFSCILVVTAVCAFLRGGAVRALLAGLALGLAFCCRPQDGLYGPPLLAAGLAARRWRDSLLLASGGAAGIVLQGIVDLCTHGAFLHAPLSYVRFNLAVSHEWGHEPWWLYPALVVGVSPLLHVGLRWLWHGCRLLPWVAACAAFSLGVHQLFEHKIARFVTPALLLVMLLWGVGAFAALPARGRFERASYLAAALLHLAGWLLVSFACPHRANVEAARFLSAQPDNTGVVYHQLGYEQTGGYFYYRAKAPLLLPSGGTLAEHLARTPPPAYLVARPGAAVDLPPGWRAERVRTFASPLLGRPRRSLEVFRLRGP